MDAATSITKAMASPEAADPKIAAALGKLQQVVLGMARGGPPQGAQGPGGGAAPGAGPAGAPAGAGMSPAGGGAVNPAMPNLSGGQLPPTPPGAGATMNVPQPNSDELRAMVAQSAG